MQATTRAPWLRQILRGPSRSELVWVAVPAAFVLLVLLFFPFRYRIEFDADEGINAIKAMMVLRGYHLYSQIWSDQPPLFTYLLASWLRVFGLRLTAGRLMVLLFSVGLIALGAGYLRKQWGPLAAVCGGLLLVILPYYIRLSVSLMIGLPAIALAVASFYMLSEWHARPSVGRLLASGLLLGLSILTKGFTVILVPVWLTGILLTVVRTPAHQQLGRRRWIGPLAWLGGLAALAAVAVIFVIGTRNVGQLLSIHLQASQVDTFQVSTEFPSLGSYLAESWPLFALAVVGAWRAVRRRKWTALYLVGWVVLGYGLLAATRPIWYHQQLLLTIPAALLAAIAVATSIDDMRNAVRHRPRTAEFALSLACLVLLLAFVTVRIQATIGDLDPRFPNVYGPQPGEEAERQLVARMSDHASETHWMFTDRPILAFLSGIPVPPNLAVISKKRLQTGELTEDEVLATLEAYSPEMILKGRFDIPAVDEYMRIRNFVRIDETLKYRLYLRRTP